MKPVISVQLHSIFEQCADDLDGALAQLADAGYEYVEPALWTGTPQDIVDTRLAFIESVIGDRIQKVIKVATTSGAELKEALDRHGLKVSASHVALPEGHAAEQIFDEQELLGNRLLVANVGFEKLDDRDTIRRLAERYNAAAEAARPRGMRIGYHNHFEEVEPVFDGQSGMEFFFDQLEPDLFAQVDAYWSFVGGRDPADLIRSLGERVINVHVKDGNGPFGDSATALGEPGTALGQGIVDIAAVLDAATHAECLTVELELMGEETFSALAESREYLLDRIAARA